MTSREWAEKGQAHWQAMEPVARKRLLFGAGLLMALVIVFHPLRWLHSGTTPPARLPVQAATAAPPVRTLPPPATDALESPGAWVGSWQGRATLAKQGGICNLTMEIRLQNTGGFTAFPVLACMPLAPFMLTGEMPKTPQAAAADYVKAFTKSNPMTAVLSGIKGQDGTVTLHVDRITGTNDSGCTWTGFTLVPFGKQLSSQWTTDKCGEGSVLLTKQRP